MSENVQKILENSRKVSEKFEKNSRKISEKIQKNFRKPSHGGLIKFII